jgi:hypothetical protein
MPTDVEPDPFFDNVVASLPTVSSESVLPPTIVEHCVAPDDSLESIDKGDIDKRCGMWNECEIIACFLAYDAASRQKQNSTRVFRAQFATGCYVKFAKKRETEGLWDAKVDMVKSRDVRFKLNKTGKNAGETAGYINIAEVKREIVNVILPIYDMLLPQGGPPSGIQWPEHMMKVKNEYFKVWKKGKKRFEGKDYMTDNWTTVGWVVFEYLGPRGMDLSFLKPGSMDDEEGGLDTSREGAI